LKNGKKKQEHKTQNTNNNGVWKMEEGNEAYGDG